MAKHKDFDKYASSIFGNIGDVLGKKTSKHAKRSSLTTIDVDTPPPPFDIKVNIKNNDDASSRSPTADDVHLSLPPSPESTPVKRRHRKTLNGVREETSSVDDDTISDTDLECFCVDHMKLCSSRCAAEEHRNCSEVIANLKRSTRSSPDSGRGMCIYPRGDGGGGGPDPPILKNHKVIWFLRNTGPDPLD